jgi:ParB/Sulfiredoxin domain
MTTRIMIDQCDSGRNRVTTATEAEIEELATSILKTSMKHPVLAIPSGDGRYIIVDGLARVAAASKLGLVTVVALVTSDLDQACQLLKEVHHDRTLSPRRIWDISRDLDPLLYGRRSKLFAFRREGKSSEWQQGMPLIADALNLRTVQTLKITRQAYRAAEALGATEVLARLDSGEWTPHQAIPYLHNYPIGGIKEPSKNPNASEQMTLLNNANRNMGTILVELNKVALEVQIDGDDLRATLVELRRHRRRLAGIIHMLEKETLDV